MVTTDELLMEHRAKSEVILFNYATMFEKLHRDNSNEFFEQLAKVLKGFQSEIAASGTDVLHKALINGDGSNIELIKSILSTNAEYGEKFSKLINE